MDKNTDNLFEKNDYAPIGEYGVIGNLKTCCLVSLRGSIDFLPFPNLDSPTIFTSLLDRKKGGFFELSPINCKATHKQLYLPQTAILLTRFLTTQGMAELTDFMPIDHLDDCSTIVRSIRSIRGEMEFELKCSPRFNYGENLPNIKIHNQRCEFEYQDLHLSLDTNVDLQERNNGIYAKFKLQEGDIATFVLHNKKEIEIDKGIVKKQFDECRNYWQNWFKNSSYKGRWREMVNRSAMVLKLLSSHKYGSVAAAATFGLPEHIGGERNWDYRYVWIRDAAFTMYAFIRLNYMVEAKKFISWVKDRFQEGDLQLLYRLNGSKELDESTLKHLEGYENSYPVRIGNDASNQTQMDIYGELIDTVYLYNKFGEGITYDFWKELVKTVDFVCANWETPDHGIWEVRSEKKHFLYSRVMCWVALDRAIRITDESSFPGPIDRWRETRDTIFKDVYENFWNEDKGAFVQFKGGNVVDASALLMPLVRFIHPNDEKWVKTMKVIEQELVTDTLVYRYVVENDQTDGLEGEEGTFSICSFWYIECLIRGGEIDKAKLYFEKMLGYANHLGLFSEQLGLNGDQLGNFPQAFTHLALISTAYKLNEELDNKNHSYE